MDPIEGLRISWRAIRGHKLRSTLTTLGIVIGIAAVITFVTMGASLQAALIGDITGDSPPVAAVWAGPNETVNSNEGGPGQGARPVFTEHDLAEIEKLEGVERVVPYGVVRTTALEYHNDTVATDHVLATTPGYFDDLNVSEGRTFEAGAREAVLNPKAAQQFEENVSVGENVTVTRADGTTVEVTVVGMLNRSDSTGPFEALTEAPRFYVPTDPFYTTTTESPTTGTDQRVYETIYVEAESHTVLEDVQTETRTYLNTSSDARELVPKDYGFAVATNEELLAQLQSILDQITGFITGIAVISLIVGSIGIANIMLVSVTERTREIGIMKAVGARKRDIVQLFLTEAAIIGIIGAVFGTLLGIGGGYLVVGFIDLELTFPVEWFPIAIGVGVLVGMLAGLYPAWNAARVDPIEALRYE